MYLFNLMRAVLLAAGMGTRLSPISDFIPKQMIPICGKPLIHYVIKDLAESGITKICLVLGKNGNLIKNFLQDGDNYNIEIQYVYQQSQIGTANALLIAKHFATKGPFFLYLSDTLIINKLKFFVKLLSSSEDSINILTSRISSDDAKSKGNVKLSGDHVIEISEKPHTNNSELVWAGVSYFTDNFIFDYMNNLDRSHTDEFEITDVMGKALKKNITIKNFSCDGFIDYGIVEGILDVTKFILKKKKFNNSFNYSDSPNSHYIGENCKIGPNVVIEKYSSIGNNVVNGKNTKISNSVILDDVTIPQNTTILNSIVSKFGTLSTHS
jgi:UDP-N-acetylglucosamine diphosphorylase / glucose-1-phosphate thymidylyltransferase / UDP-N-acetylgalactosamine diphosphorylase / glucosamine-1-phosphate N-acetyltransferase / galactosamine-1-phosphate N-acetyltransferase